MAAHFCPHCRVKSNMTAAASHQLHTILACQNCGESCYAINTPDGYRLVYPQVQTEAPSAYPPEVGDNFSEALRSLNGANYKSCVVMTRSALQAATRSLDAKGRTLFDEIDDLAARHVIPTSLKDWAHEIRDGGNLVAHPEPAKRVAKEDAEELLALAESIFEYLYVVPHEVAQRRARLNATSPP